MPQIADTQAAFPLTLLQEEERLFQASVRQFAKERLAPQVRAMDEEGKFRKDLLREMFNLGLMSIDIQEQYGGQGGTFFQSGLALEEVGECAALPAILRSEEHTSE